MQRVFKQVIASAAASGEAVFYMADHGSAAIALGAYGGTNPVAAYTVSLYATPDTPDSMAYTYKTQTPAAVLVYENVTDSDGVAYPFYKMKIAYSDLTNNEGSGAYFVAYVIAS